MRSSTDQETPPRPSRFHFSISPPVFFASVAIIVLFMAVGVLFPGDAQLWFSVLQKEILSRFGWFYLLSVGIFLGGVLILALGRTGDLKLGPDDSEPDFPFLSWLAMLFAAGMGIGLMYFGVGEPMAHFNAPPDAVPGTVAAQREAMSVTFFHWGIHAWAIYAVTGLALGYFGYRYNLPLTMRSGLYPLLKERIHGVAGHAVDTFAVCGTIFGMANSLGFGVLQISAGIDYLFGTQTGPMAQVALIIVITAFATLSVVSGLEKGVRRLSEVNLIMAAALMLFVLFVGPTGQLMRDFVQNIGLYLDKIVLRTFNIYAYEPKPWIDAWTLFYWAWWISWSPFVGMFIARISRGRTVREFVLAVLFIPAGFTFLWMTVFGNTALFVDQNLAGGALSEAVAADMSVALFSFFEYLPLPAITSTLAVIMVAIFFITGADSGALVVDTLASGGKTETGLAQRIFWCAMGGVVAAVLLLSGGLEALQSVTIASALPFTVVMLILLWALFKGMRADLAQRTAYRRNVPAPAHPAAGPSWQRRLGLALHAPSEGEVKAFIQSRVMEALQSVAAELTRRDRPAQAVFAPDTGFATLTSEADNVRPFIYGVQPTTRPLPAFTMGSTDDKDQRFEARTWFSDGSTGYDVMGLSTDQIIGDVLVQFERYLALVQSPEAALVTTAPPHL